MQRARSRLDDATPPCTVPKKMGAAVSNFIAQSGQASGVWSCSSQHAIVRLLGEAQLLVAVRIPERSPRLTQLSDALRVAAAWLV